MIGLAGDDSPVSGRILWTDGKREEMGEMAPGRYHRVLAPDARLRMQSAATVCQDGIRKAPGMPLSKVARRKDAVFHNDEVNSIQRR